MKIKRKEKIAGGTKENPYYKEYGPYLCVKCDVKAKTIKTEDRSSSTPILGRGILIRKWEEITYKCPKCNVEEIVCGYVYESDGSYYSNEERRVYNL